MVRLAASLVIFAVAGLMAAAGPAFADSRLFGARSDTTGVTVVGAALDGKPLTVAGQGGGVTFFRIDNPGHAVPCANRIAFTGSNGKVKVMDADVCTNGAEVSVSFSDATAAPPPPPPSDTPPPPPPDASSPPAAAETESGNQPVTIATDEPAISIDSVFMGGQPVAINRRIGNAVEVLVVPGPDGIDCSRDLGLVLSDGRRVARDVDICANDWQVVVALGARPSAPATPEPPSLPPAPSAPAATVDTAGLQWMFVSGRDNGSLAFAVPQTDESEFTAVCAPRSGEVTIALGRSAPEVQPGEQVTVGFAAGGFSRSYTATGSDVSQAGGLSNPLITVKTIDSLWLAIIRESSLTVQIGSAAPYALSLKGSAAQTKPFLSYCDLPSAIAAPPRAPAPPASVGGIPFACDNGAFIRVTFDDANGRAVVAMAGAPPMELHRVASRRGARYVAGGAELIGYAETINWKAPGDFPSTCRPR